MVLLFQVLVALYIRNFGMESPLNLFNLEITYQLANNPPKNCLGRS